MGHPDVQVEAEDEEEDSRHDEGTAADKLEKVDATTGWTHHDGLYADESDKCQDLKGASRSKIKGLLHKWIFLMSQHHPALYKTSCFFFFFFNQNFNGGSSLYCNCVCHRQNSNISNLGKGLSYEQGRSYEPNSWQPKKTIRQSSQTTAWGKKKNKTLFRCSAAIEILTKTTRRLAVGWEWPQSRRQNRLAEKATAPDLDLNFNWFKTKPPT